METTVLIAGGGLGGATLAKQLENDFHVILVDSKDYFEITWATLRAYVEPSIASQIVIPHKQYLKKAQVKIGVLTGVTENSVILEDGTAISFDILVIATGSKPREQPILTWKDRIQFYEDEAKKLKAANSILVVGGGPVGVEFAGELVTDFPDKKVTIIHSGERLLEFVKPAASQKALKLLNKKSVEVIFQDRVEETSGGGYSTVNSRKGNADYVFWAVGSKLSTSWLSGLPGLLDSKGQVKTTPALRVEGFSNMFAIGDVTSFEGAKQGYIAMSQAKIAAVNIKKVVKDGSSVKGLKSFAPGPAVAMISFGRSNGVAQLPFGTFTGWFPTKMKSKGLFISMVRSELGLSK